jgi:uncharacterized FAD-dependent dehydrogenase
VERSASSGFRLFTREGAIIETDRLVLGCGRSAHAFLRRTFQKIGIDYTENSPDVGLRLEAPAAVFGEDYSYQADPKYKFDHGNIGSSRTFCACNGGVVVPVQFGKSLYAEGAFFDNPTNNNNVAFMTRTNRPISTEHLERWCKTVNQTAGRNLLLGELPLQSLRRPELVNSILGMFPAWPSDEHQTIMGDLLRNMLCGGLRFFDGLESGIQTAKIYGPAIDLYWPRPTLERGLATNVDGFFVLGDATGVSRGIIQALLSGVSWAIEQTLEAERGPNRARVSESVPAP